MTTHDSTTTLVEAPRRIDAAGHPRNVRRAMFIALPALAVLLATVSLQAVVWATPVGPVLSHSRALDVASAFMAFAWSGVGCLVLARRPANRVGLVLLVAGIAGQTWILAAYYACVGLVAYPGSVPAAVEAAWLSSWVKFLEILAYMFLFVMFPDGILPSRRWRSVAWFVGLALALVAFVWATEPGPLYGVFLGVNNPFGIAASGPQLHDGTYGLLVLAGLASVTAMLVRFRGSSGTQRRQIKWFTYTAAASALTWVTAVVAWDVWRPFATTVELLYPIAPCAVLLAVFISIFRHNLYDIDVVVSRTIVVGALAVLVTTGYVAVVAVVGAAIGRAGETSLGLSVLATAVVATAFQPVRTRVQRMANRLVYGKRATPYEVLTVLARRMGDVYAADDLLPHLAKTLTEGTGASRVEVWLRADHQLRRVASWPDDVPRSPELLVEGVSLTVPGASEVAAVRHQGVLVGALAVALPPGQELSAIEQRLLADLAAQVGVVLDNLRLIEDLKTSRMRIVAAQDEERRRIERDIHDGVQQRLVSLNIALRMTADRLKSTVHDEVAAAVDDAAAEARATLAELRQLARGIHPVIVSEGGLITALHSLAERSPVPTEVVAQPTERLPAPVEVTVYYVVAEALANVAKHARATGAAISVEQSNGHIHITVTDNGIGGAAPSAGSGLTGLADRVNALTGVLTVDSPPGRGTRLRADIPCMPS